MIYAVGLILAMQTVIVWRVSRYQAEVAETLRMNGKYWAMANKLLGEINVKQADFDKQVEKLNEKVAGIDSSLETESGEIKQNFTALREEITRLQQSQGENIDTSKLDEISSRLESSATRISGLVDPLPVSGQTPPVAEPAPTVDATATATAAATPATSVKTETTVTTKTEDAADETTGAATETTATATADTANGEVAAEAEATTDAVSEKDAE